MPDIGQFHPQIVHFVIAGAGLGIFFRWVSLTGKLPWTDRAATALIIIGTIAAWAAVTSGAQTHELSERIPGVAQAVRLHEDAGHDTRNLLYVIAVLELVALLPAVTKWRQWIIVASGLLGVWGAYDIYNVGHLGGAVVYSYAGGVGTRTGDTSEVNNVVRSALFNRAMLSRQEKNPAMAAQEFAELAERFPDDPNIKMLAVESILRDRNDPKAALAALNNMGTPPDTSRSRTRYDMDKADAFVALGQKDSAVVILTALAKKFPQSRRIQSQLDKLK